MLARLIPSIGTVGDALNIALAETTVGLYKTECTREGSPFCRGPSHTLADLENITFGVGALVQREQTRAPTTRRSRGRVLR